MNDPLIVRQLGNGDPTTAIVVSNNRIGLMFDKQIGIVLLDAIFQSFLLGIVFTQAASYFHKHKWSDEKPFKLFVVLVCFCSLFQTVVENVKAWWVLAEQKPLVELPIYFFSLWINGLVISLCQAYFVGRCWKLTGHKPWMLYPMAALLTLTTLSILYYSINVEMGLLAFRSHGLKESPWLKENPGFLRLGYDISITTWIFGCLTIDTYVATILTWSIFTRRIKLEKSRSTLKVVLFAVWQTAILPQLCMLTAAIIFRAHTQNGKYNLIVLFVTLAGKLYVYTFLFILNSRENVLVPMDLGYVRGHSGNSETQRDIDALNNAVRRERRSLESGNSAMSVPPVEGLIPAEEYLAAGLPVDSEACVVPPSPRAVQGCMSTFFKRAKRG